MISAFKMPRIAVDALGSNSWGSANLSIYSEWHNFNTCWIRDLVELLLNIDNLVVQ